MTSLPFEGSARGVARGGDQLVVLRTNTARGFYEHRLPSRYALDGLAERVAALRLSGGHPVALVLLELGRGGLRPGLYWIPVGAWEVP